MIIRTTIGAVAIACFACFAFAGDPWDGAPFQASGADVQRAVAERTAAADADVELLLDDIVITYDEQGRKSRVSHQVIRILNAKGVDAWSVVRVPWSPWYQERPQIRARVIVATGATFSLDPVTIAEAPHESSMPETLTDDRVLQAPLPALAPDAVIELQITEREVRPFGRSGTIGREELVHFCPCAKLRLTFDVPQQLAFRCQVRGTSLEPTVQHRNGRKTVRLEPTPTRLTEIQPLLPPDVPTWPHVVFTTGTAWSEVAREYADFVEQRLASKRVAAIARGVTAKRQSRDETIRVLLAKTHELVRYTGLEFGQSAIVPHTPDETLDRRYGDCKDKALLFVALLRAAGIHAHLALVRVGHVEDVPETMPGLNAFDHAIVYIPGAAPLWVDPTNPTARVGELPIYDRGRQALIASRETTGLVRTPDSRPAENQLLVTREVFLSKHGLAQLREMSETRGSVEHEYRAGYGGQTAPEMRELWQEYVRQLHRAQSLDSLDYSDPNDLSKPFRVAVGMSQVRRGVTDDERAVAVLPVVEIFGRLPPVFRQPVDSAVDSEVEGSTKKPRTEPFVLREPYATELRYRVVAPPGFELTSAPEGRTDHIGPATLSLHFRRESAQELLATVRFDAGHGRFTADEARALRERITHLNDDGNDPVGLNVTVEFDRVAARYLAEGRIREALQECRRLVEREPDDAVYRIQFAQALLAAGLGDAARAMALSAVEKDDTCAYAHAERGLILTHDLLGRKFHPGFDWHGAELSYRKAIELDPTDMGTRGNLAILWEHDVNGGRYSKQSQLEDAIREYRELREKVSEPSDLTTNLIVALSHSDRYAEMRKLLTSPGTPQQKLSLLAAIAGTDGVAAAVARAPRLFPKPDERFKALLEMSDHFNNHRDYAKACELLDAAMRLNPQVEAAMGGIRDIAQQMRHWEDVLEPETDPRHVVQQVYLAALVGGEQLQAARKWFLPSSAMVGSLPADLHRLQAILWPQRKSVLDRDAPPERLLDALCGLNLEIDGSDEIGYRISANFLGGEHPTWFIVRTDEGYRICDTGFRHSGIGTVALRQIGKGNLDGARQWLDWARAEEGAAKFLANPFHGSPFSRIWTTGQRGDEAHVQLAAAALLVSNPVEVSTSIVILEKVREFVSTPRRFQVDRLLAQAMYEARRDEAVLEVTARLLQYDALALEPTSLRIQSLVRLGRAAKAREVIDNRLAQMPNDAWGLERSAELAVRAEDHKAAEKAYARLAKLRAVTADSCRAEAWSSLLLDPVPPRALAAASLAAQTESHPAYWCTLAAAYAEHGQLQDAVETLRLIFDTVGQSEPNDEELYVLGRVAEGYGLPDVAAQYYRKVQPTEDFVGVVAHRLAQRKLAAIQQTVSEPKVISDNTPARQVNSRQ